MRGHSLHECGFQENNFHKRDCLRFFFGCQPPASRDLTPTLVRFKAELTQNLQTPLLRARLRAAGVVRWGECLRLKREAKVYKNDGIGHTIRGEHLALIGIVAPLHDLSNLWILFCSKSAYSLGSSFPKSLRNSPSNPSRKNSHQIK